MSSNQLGPYVIERVLGKGGMGVVYAAVHGETGQRAAVKVLAATLSGKTSFRTRFQSEIETLKRLKHPRIVEYYGYGEQDAQLYYAMELVEGASLQDSLKAGRVFTVEEVLHWAIEIAGALKLAHDSGVIHRDLKPANLLLTTDGHVKLTDFGIAKLFGGSSLTVTGGMVGTPDYMAPEQAEGKSVTERSDLYALGGVIFGLLARRPPFASGSLPELLHAVRYDEAPRLRTLAPHAPAELELLVGELLQKLPEKRPPTALVVSKRLKEMQDGLPNLPSVAAASLCSQAEEELSLSLDVGPSPLPDACDIPTRLQSKSPFAKTVLEQGVSPKRTGDRGTDHALDDGAASSVDRTGVTQVDSAASISRASLSHFTSAVEEEREKTLRAEKERQSEYKQLLAQVLLGAAVLAGIIGGGWYLRQPLSASRLFERIRETVEADPENGLVTARSDIDDFLSYYPTDAQVETVRDWQLAIQQQITRRQVDRRLRRDDEGEQLEPVERWYADAMHVAVGRPALALRQLEALIAAFGDDEQASQRTKQVVDLARQQRVRLIRINEEWQRQSLELAESRLQAAAEKQAAGNPEAARRIYQGLIELYGEATWAQSIVQTARESLAKL
ncbi:MAG: serine/threonine protein kinase [Planctomycetota bacterium]